MDSWEPYPPAEAAAVFAAYDRPWWLAGGWALDAFVGRTTRAHGDIDVAVLARDRDAVRALFAGWDLLRNAHCVWCRPAPGEPWRLQLLLEEADGDDWVYRRDARVRRPLATLGEDHVLAPEVQLLYKLGSTDPKDVADVALVTPLLLPGAAEWLTRATRLLAAGSGGR